MVMMLSNYTGTADTFTFPHNPQSFDDPIDNNYSITSIPYSRYHILVSSGGIPPKSIILSGHFDGASKLTNYRGLAKHVAENNLLKKLYWETDKFYLCVGKQIKQTNTGARVNMIDYVATFETILDILFGNTQRTSGVNAGNTTTFIEDISGTVTSGASDITISDGLGNSISIPASSLTTGQAFSLKFVNMVSAGGGIYVSEYNYCEVDSTQINTVQTTTGSGLLQLAAAANMTTITTTNITDTVVKFRDGWIA